MAKKSVLFIEDNPGDVKLMRMALSSFEYVQFIHIDNGEDALSQLEQMQSLPDFIVLDLNLPGMNGFEILHIIRQNERLLNIKVAIFTSAPMQKEATYNLPLYDKYIIKPLVYDEFREVLHDLCREWLRDE